LSLSVDYKQITSSKVDNVEESMMNKPRKKFAKPLVPDGQLRDPSLSLIDTSVSREKRELLPTTCRMSRYLQV
jgi:hypothetical protein